MIRKQKGFSLIELLIVVAIILIIAAIAIPNLLRARIAANESSSVASIRTVNTAEITYQTGNPGIGFASAMAVLGGTPPCTLSATAACLIDNTLALGTKSGYVFTGVGTVVGSGAIRNSLLVTAVPQNWNQSGVRAFCSTEDAVIRYISPVAAPAAVATGALCLSGYTVLQ